MQIFISYSRKDIDFVRKLAGDLEKAAYDVWWDLTDLHGGDDWPRAIPAAIEASQTFIIVLSPNSAVSDWVEKEYTHALSFRRKIIPLMLQRSSVPFALNTINYVDFTSEDYAANFNNLLTALGHTGERPVVEPFSTAALPALLRKYAIPIGIGVFVLLAILSVFLFKSDPPPTTTPSSTPTTPAVILTDTDTPTVSPTVSPTVTLTPTLTETPTSTTSPTPTPTRARAFSLPICVYYPSVSGVHVRRSPSTGAGSDPLAKALEADGSDCPFFSTRIENEASEIWFQVAPAEHQKEKFKPYAGGWIYSELLVVVDRRWGTLPMCVYNRSVGTVYIRDASSESDFNRIGEPVEADGTHCLFFSSPIEDEAKEVWYQVAPAEYQRAEFKQYAGGWIPAEWLAIVDTKRLPVVTLTPTSTPSNTPTITQTFTPTNTPTITPTFTRTSTNTPPTDTPMPTDTETPLPTETPTPE
jgi:hypothetical protein